VGGVEDDAARQRLEAERERLEGVVHAMDADHLHDEPEDDSSSGIHLHNHPADVGSDAFEREKDFSILETVEAELHDVERALTRLDEGTYGTCEACGCDLPDERLEAVPAARFCVEHQAASEARFG
jgi:RNA polymerase-binding transcription factor DksA